MQIICPHCGLTKEIPQEKIPAGVRWANCPQCKNRFELASPGLGAGYEKRPEVQGAGSRAERRRSPWEARSELGLWKGIHHTLRSVLFSPKDLFSSMTYTGGTKEPLAFGLLTGALGTMIGLFWQFVLMSAWFPSLGRDILDQGTLTILFLVGMILSPLYVILSILITAGIVHVCLLMVRGGKNGFEATLRVVSYSQATQILALIPFVGGMAGWLWQFVVQMIGLRAIHEMSYARIIVAFLIPLVLVVILAVAVMIPLFFLI